MGAPDPFHKTGRIRRIWQDTVIMRSDLIRLDPNPESQIKKEILLRMSGLPPYGSIFDRPQEHRTRPNWHEFHIVRCIESASPISRKTPDSWPSHRSYAAFLFNTRIDLPLPLRNVMKGRCRLPNVVPTVPSRANHGSASQVSHHPQS